MHTITVNPDHGMVEVTVEGFWTSDHLRVFAGELLAALQAATAGGRSSIVLCDYTRAAIQSQEVVAALQAFMANPPIRSRKVALFTKGMLARQQARRLAATRDEIRVFDDRAAALAWLEA